MSEPHAPTLTGHSPNTNPSQMNVIQHSLILNTIRGYMEFKSQIKSLIHSILLLVFFAPAPPRLSSDKTTLPAIITYIIIIFWTTHYSFTCRHENLAVSGHIHVNDILQAGETPDLRPGSSDPHQTGTLTVNAVSSKNTGKILKC